MDIFGDMFLFVAPKSDVLAGMNFFCCSILASVRDLIKHLGVKR